MYGHSGTDVRRRGPLPCCHTAVFLPPRVGDLVLRVDRLYLDDADDPVELAVSYFDPAHYSYRAKLRRGPS
jgi:hypothetical protein